MKKCDYSGQIGTYGYSNLMKSVKIHFNLIIQIYYLVKKQQKMGKYIIIVCILLLL